MPIIEAIQDLNVRQVQALADAHIADYEKKLKSRFARPHECAHLIEVWKGTRQLAQGDEAYPEMFKS